MKLFAFPHVVLNELMTNMEPVELISLSFCSKNAYALVKLCSMIKDELKVQSFTHREYGYSLCFPKRKLSACAMTRSASILDTTNLGNSHGIKYCFDDSGSLYTFWSDYVVGGRETTKYICDLFKIPVSSIVVYRDEDLWMIDLAQQRQEEPLREVHAVAREMSADGYTRILSCNTTETVIILSSPPRAYRFEGKLPPVKNLSVTIGFWITREHLLDLGARNTQLKFTHLNSSDINALLRSWLSGGLPNLRYLKLEAPKIDENSFDGFRDRLEPVQREITYKWDEDAAAAKFNTKAFHLRREDNVVATVSIECGRIFRVVVWPDLNGNRV